MILAFQDDGSMCVLGSVAEANRDYEAVDVEDGSIIFLDERGCWLRPVFTGPIRKRWLFFFTSVETVPFTFQPTEEKWAGLLDRLVSGEIRIEPGETSVRTLDDLRRTAPGLFNS